MHPQDTTPHKTCTKCGQTKPVAEFSRNKTRPDGLQEQCKSCNRAYQESNRQRIRERRRSLYEANREADNERSRAYRRANLERLREYDRQRTPTRREWKIEYDRVRYAAADKEKERESRRSWRIANQEYNRQHKRARYLANPQAVKDRVSRWVAVNPEKIKEYSARRRSRKNQAEGTHTAADIKTQYERQKGRCYYCGASVSDTYDVDHVVPLSRGGSNWPDNIVVACPSCNRSKNDKLPHEWIEGGRLI